MKQIHRLTESQLMEIIETSVKKVLSEINNQKEPVRDERVKELFNLSNVTLQDWNNAYYDYSNMPHVHTQDNDTNFVNESKYNITPIEEVEKRIKTKFRLRNFQYAQHDDGSYVAVIIPMIRYNHNLITNEMKDCGYYLNAFWKETSQSNRTWEYLQFLPYHQHNINKEVIQGKVLYHTSPIINKESILSNGLIPCHNNSVFSYPRQVHLFKANTPLSEIKGMGKKLYDADTNKSKSDVFSIFEIDVTALPHNLKYFKDNDAFYGVFVRKRIPPDAIRWIMDYRV